MTHLLAKSVNGTVVMFVDPEAREKGKSVPHIPCELHCGHVR